MQCICIYKIAYWTITHREHFNIMVRVVTIKRQLGAPPCICFQQRPDIAGTIMYTYIDVPNVYVTHNANANGNGRSTEELEVHAQ